MKIKVLFLHLLVCISLANHAYANQDKILQLQNRITMLEKKISLAKQQHALWRDTSMLLSQAKSSLTSNEIEKTLEIINQVELELEKSLEQSNSQNDISKLVPYYLKN
jgi:uncharacterized membrane protein YgaE (UPF0421/DUF939 family)